MRVLAIHALEDLKASEALPKLRELLADNERCNFDKLESVAHAAQSAIAKQLGRRRTLLGAGKGKSRSLGSERRLY
jgi:hypothetical protein